jgi:hypothetical protein
MTKATMDTDLPSTLDLLSAGDLVDRLAGLTVDQLRALEGRLEDAHRVVKAILRERLALARRDAGWKARELAFGIAPSHTQETP